MSIVRLRVRLRAVYVKFSNLFIKQCFLKVLTFTEKADVLSSFEHYFISIGWIVSKIDGILLAEGSPTYPVSLLVSLLFTAFFATAAILMRDILAGALTVFFVFISLTLYSVRPIVAITKAGEGYFVVADPEEGYPSILTFLKSIGGGVQEERSFADQGVPIPIAIESYLIELKKAYEKAEKPAEARTAVVSTQQVETEALGSTIPSAELANLMNEINELRVYLNKLDEMKLQGKISERVYEELKKEYTRKIEELEKRISELKK